MLGEMKLEKKAQKKTEENIKKLIMLFDRNPNSLFHLDKFFNK